MSLDMQHLRSTEPEAYAALVTFAGNGAGVPTKMYGKGATVVRTAAGTYKISFADSPGNFVGYNGEFQATTPSLCAGWTSVVGAYVPAAGATLASITVVTYNATFAATDMATTQTICMFLMFKRAGITV